MPAEYADIETYITNMVKSFGGRIRKVLPPPNGRGKFRLEITGNYRYCENVKRHHTKNRIYFLVDPIKKVYFQRCYDPDCHGFQSAKQKISINRTVHNQPANNSTGKYSTE
jgi:hypothetical protein